MVYCFDIDGTICTLQTKSDYENAEPFLEMVEQINKLYDEGHTIIYWTARGTKTGIPWFHVTKKQLDQWNAKYHELRMNKPAYDLFIDDKNMESEAYFSINS